MKIIKALFIKIIIKISLLSLLTSCISLYRLNLGVTGKNTTFKSKVLDENDEETEEQICVRDDRGTSSNPCGENGLAEHQNPADLIPSIELKPNYFKDSKFGWSTFLDYNSINTVLVGYPFDGDETKFVSDRYSVNPHIFYNLGTKYIKHQKGKSFKFGLGPSISYVPRIKMRRKGTDESFTLKDKIEVGANIFLEFNYNWFTLRIQNSIVYYEDTKFDDAPNDTLEVAATSVGFYYSYYIGDILH